MKRFAIIAASLLVALAILAGGGFYFLTRTERAQRLVSQRALPALEAALEARVSVGGMAGTLTGGLIWRDVKIVWPELTLTIDKTTFWVDFLALADRHFRITRLEAENPKAVLTIDPETGEGTGPSWSPKERRTKIGAIIRELMASPGRAWAADEPGRPAPSRPVGEGEWRVSIENISLTGGRFEGLEELTGPVKVGVVDGLFGGGRLAYGPDWDIQGRLKGRLELTGKDCRLELAASMVGLVVEAKRLALLFGPKGRSELTLAGPLDVSRVEGRIEFKADIEPADLTHLFEAEALPGRIKLAGRLEGDHRALEIAARGAVGETGLEVQGSVKPYSLDFTARGEVSDLNPALLGRLAGAELPAGRADVKFDLAGRLPHDVAGRLDLARLRLDGLLSAERATADLKYAAGALAGKLTIQGGRGRGFTAQRIDAAGRAEADAGRARIDFSQARGLGGRAEKGGFELAWRGRNLTVRNFKIVNGPGRLTGSAVLKLADGAIETGRVELELDRFKPPAGYILSRLGLSLPVADLVSVRLTGPLTAVWPGGRVELTAKELNLTSDWGDIEVTGRLIADPGGRLTDWNVFLDLSQFRPPEWLLPMVPPEWRQAIINGHITLQGYGPQARFGLDLGGSVMRGRSLERLTASGRFGPEDLYLHELAVSLAGAEAAVSGSIRPEIDLKAKIEGRGLGRLLAVLDLPPAIIAESYSFDGRIGRADDRIGLTGRLELTRTAWKALSAGSLTAELNLPDLTDLRGKARIRAVGFTYGRHSFELRAELAGGPQAVSGRLSLQGRLGGAETEFALNRPPDGGVEVNLATLVLAVNLKQGVEMWKSVRPAALSLTGWGLERIELDLAGPSDQRITLDAAASQGRIKGRCRLERLELAALSSVLGPWLITGGLMSADIALAGPVDSPSLTMDGWVDNLYFADEKLDGLMIRARYQDGRLTGRAKVDLKGRVIARVEAELPVRLSFAPYRFEPDPNALTARVNLADAPLCVLRSLTAGLDELEGRVNGEINLTSNREGWLNVDEMSALITANGQRFEKGRLRTRLSGSRLTVDEFTAQSGGGALKVKGWIELADTTTFDLETRLSPMDIQLGPYGRATLSAATVLRGSLAAPKLSGRIKVESLSFKLPPQAPPESREIHLVDPVEDDAPPPLAALPGAPSEMDVNLKIDIGPSARLRGEGLEAAVGGGLTVVKPAGKPIAVTGRVDIESGRATRFGRRFNIETGSLIFSGQTPPEPTLTARATTRVGKVDITLVASGPLTKPNIELTSQPVKSREDIFSYLLFGRPASGLSENESIAMEAQAISALGGPAAEMIRGLLDERITPDVFSVSASAEGGVSVETGKQILPDLYLSYEAFTEPTKPNEIHLEYRLTPHISLESSMGDEKTSGVDIYFNFDF